MKRTAALILAAVLLFCLAASAENTGLILTAFDDFTLQTGAALSFSGEKADGMPLFAFCPAAEGNVTLSAVNAIWFRTQEPAAAEEFSASIRSTETAIRAQYEAGGQLLKSFDVGEAAEKELWGLPALVCDTELLVQVNETEVCLMQRSIRVTGAFGTYLFSISAWSADLLEEAEDALVQALQWN